MKQKGQEMIEYALIIAIIAIIAIVVLMFVRNSQNELTQREKMEGRPAINRDPIMPTTYQ